MASRLHYFALCLTFLLIAASVTLVQIYFALDEDGHLPRLISSRVHTSVQETAHDHGCYQITRDWKQHLASHDVLEKLGCKQRLPKVLIVGARTSGAQTLRNVLGFHPDLVTPMREVQFFDNHFDLGTTWYESQMPYSTPHQMTIEGTENYMYHRNASLRAFKTLGQGLKLIALIRDPVARSISDYLYTKGRLRTSKMLSAHFKGTFKESRMKDRLLINSRGKRGGKGSTKLSYVVEDTFESTVTRSDGEINRKHIFIADSMYVYYLRNWVKRFTPYQVLAVNAEIFARRPAEVLSQVEKFLGIKNYFKPEQFNFNLSNGTFCLKEPVAICMPHLQANIPVITNETVLKLRKNFESSSRFLFLLLKNYISIIGDVPLDCHTIR